MKTPVRVAPKPSQVGFGDLNRRISVDDLAQAVEAELRRWLDQRPRTGAHYDMLAYHMGWLDESLQPTTVPGGKRFRPLLCLLSCLAVGGQWESALPMAAAIEFLHNFSLIHDDIEDGDESRRHRPTVWKLFGEPLAINAGDAMLALAGMAALATNGKNQLAVAFQETALALTEGQYLDMSFESRADVSTGDYFAMIGLKTGALITHACESGGRLGAGSPAQVEALRVFGVHFGRAFQIHDDILGVWAPLEETGKAAGKDILNRKKSLPILLALDMAEGNRREFLIDYYHGRAEADPGLVADAMLELGVRDQANGYLAIEMNQAFAALDGVEYVPEYAAALRDLASGLVA